MSDITNEWKELRQRLGEFICRVDGMNISVDSKLKKLQEKEEQQVDLQAQIDEAYNKGIKDLYDAICTLMLPSLREYHPKVPLMPIPDMRKIFGTVYSDKIIVKNTPEEIIDKVNQWKAEKDKEEQELHVGDEVTTDNGFVGIIIDVGNNDGIVWVSYRITPEARGFDFCWVSKIKCKKTGRHFDSIPFDYNPEKEKVYDLFIEPGVDESDLKKEENK